MVENKYNNLWCIAHELGSTSAILDAKEGSVTFAKTGEYLKNLYDVHKNIHVIVPYDIDISVLKKLHPSITVHILAPEDDIQYVFTYIHNSVNKDKDPKLNIISEKVDIHPSAVIGVPGNTLCTCPDGSKLNLKHMGNVIIEDGVEIQALSVVHRASLTSTVIKKDAKIFAKVNVGHNCIIGERTIVAPGTLLSGDTIIGADCYIWQGVITKGHISICDEVIVGAGSLVTKDIVKPGVYFGTPAKYIKPYDSKLR